MKNILVIILTLSISFLANGNGFEGLAKIKSSKYCTFPGSGCNFAQSDEVGACKVGMGLAAKGFELETIFDICDKRFTLDVDSIQSTVSQAGLLNNADVITKAIKSTKSLSAVCSGEAIDYSLRCLD